MCATAFVVEFPSLVASSEARVTPRHHTSGKSFFSFTAHQRRGGGGMGAIWCLTRLPHPLPFFKRRQFVAGVTGRPREGGILLDDGSKSFSPFSDAGKTGAEGGNRHKIG